MSSMVKITLRRIIPNKVTKKLILLMILTALVTLLMLLHVSSDFVIKCLPSHMGKISYGCTVNTDFNYIKYINRTWNRSSQNNLLTLFTTWNPSMQKPIVYQNAVTNWHSFHASIRTILFTNESGIKDIAIRGKWEIMPIKRTACYGTPVLRTMFEEAINLPLKSKLYAYANADLVFNEGLVKTLTEVTKNSYFEKGPVLVVGKRIDVNISLLNEPPVNTVDDVDKLASHGNISWGFAADYFVTNELFPWEYVPDLVIGRPLVDNWLIWYARQVGAKVIDATGTILAVHQLANGLKRILHGCNKAEMWKSNLLPTLPIWKGNIECAAYETKYNGKGDVIIVPKLYLPTTCLSDEVIFH